MATEAVHADVIPMQMVPTPSDWFSVLKQYGLATSLVLILLTYLLVFVVEPNRKAQQQFLDSVIKTNEMHAEVARKQTEIQTQQAKALTDLSVLLQQIRDDQRRGAWLEHKPAGAGT